MNRISSGRQLCFYHRPLPFDADRRRAGNLTCPDIKNGSSGPRSAAAGRLRGVVRRSWPRPKGRPTTSLFAPLSAADPPKNLSGRPQPRKVCPHPPPRTTYAPGRPGRLVGLEYPTGGGGERERERERERKNRGGDGGRARAHGRGPRLLGEERVPGDPRGRAARGLRGHRRGAVRLPRRGRGGPPRLVPAAAAGRRADGPPPDGVAEPAVEPALPRLSELWGAEALYVSRDRSSSSTPCSTRRRPGAEGVAAPVRWLPALGLGRLGGRERLDARAAVVQSARHARAGRHLRRAGRLPVRPRRPSQAARAVRGNPGAARAGQSGDGDDRRAPGRGDAGAPRAGGCAGCRSARTSSCGTTARFTGAPRTGPASRACPRRSPSSSRPPSIRPRLQGRGG